MKLSWDLSGKKKSLTKFVIKHVLCALFVLVFAGFV